MQTLERAALLMAVAPITDIACHVETLGLILQADGGRTSSKRRNRHRSKLQRVRTKAYKGSKAAKRASRPKRKLTRRQRWAA